MGCNHSKDESTDREQKHVVTVRGHDNPENTRGKEKKTGSVQMLGYAEEDLNDFEDELAKDQAQQERDKEEARRQEELRQQEEAAERERWEREMQEQERQDAREQEKLKQDLESGKIQQDIYVLDS